MPDWYPIFPERDVGTAESIAFDVPRPNARTRLAQMLRASEREIRGRVPEKSMILFLTLVAVGEGVTSPKDIGQVIGESHATAAAALDRAHRLGLLQTDLTLSPSGERETLWLRQRPQSQPDVVSDDDFYYPRQLRRTGGAI